MVPFVLEKALQKALPEMCLLWYHEFKTDKTPDDSSQE